MTDFQTPEADETADAVGSVLLAGVRLTDRHVADIWNAHSGARLDEYALLSIARQALSRTLPGPEGEEVSDSPPTAAEAHEPDARHPGGTLREAVRRAQTVEEAE